MRPGRAFTVLFEPDPLHVELLGYEVEGSALAGANPESVVAESFQEGAMFGVLWGCSPPGEHLAPAGERLLLGKLRFRIGARVPAGEVELEPVLRLFGTNVVTQSQGEARVPRAPSTRSSTSRATPPTSGSASSISSRPSIASTG